MSARNKPNRDINLSYFIFVIVQSLASLCLTLCDSMDCACQASLSFIIFQSFLRLMSIEAVMWFTISSSVVPFSCPQSFPASGSFPGSQLLASRGQSIGASASASIFPVSIQDWFPLGLTGLISLLSNGLSRAFSYFITIYIFFYYSWSLVFCFCSWEFFLRSEFLSLTQIQFNQPIWKEDLGLNLFHINMEI